MSPLGPALAARPRAPAPSRFLGTFPRYTSSAARARAPVLASAPGRCAHPTRPGGPRSPVLDRPPRLNPDASLGFLGRLRSGGDFLSAPPPPRHEGKCSVRTDAPYFCIFFSKLTELFQSIPIPSISLTAWRKLNFLSLAGTPIFSSLTPGTLPLRPWRLLAPAILQTFSTMEKSEGRKDSSGHRQRSSLPREPECSFTMCISTTG